MKYALSAVAVLATIFGTFGTAHAQTEIALIAPGSSRAAVQPLAMAFEAKTGNKVKATFAMAGPLKQQVLQGDAFDVAVLQPPFTDVLASGNLAAASQTPLAQISVGVAVKKGAAKPDISSAAAVKAMLLAAKSVAYPNPAGGAAAGVSFGETLKKLGIADEVAAKAKLVQGGPAGTALVAKGEADVALAFMSEMTDPGIDVVGPLPEDISAPTKYVGFLSAKPKDPAAAKALLDYLASPAAAPIYKDHGMVPGR
jgi:molybdate transport system substrate-binding protein